MNRSTRVLERDRRTISVQRCWAIILFAVTVIWPIRATAQEDPYEEARLKMVEERVEREGINNPVVLKAVREVPRHLFVAPSLRQHAYMEQILDIGYKQTLSTAYIVSYEIQAIDPQPTDRVLEIGTGSGYAAAVLSKTVKEVYTIEIVEPLAEEARERLKKLGYTNIKVKAGDGFKGWPEHAPFDKIIITCSPEKVPQPLADQLREGGKMVVPLGKRYQQCFYLFEKKEGKLIENKLLPTLFVPMTGMADLQRTSKEDPANPKIANGGFEESTDGVAEAWFYQRQATLEHSGAREGKTYITFSNMEPGRDAHVLQALGIEGARVASVRISALVKAEAALPGNKPEREQPALVINFYDSNNRPLRSDHLGPWLGTFNWKRSSKEIKVPKETKTAMIQVGLRGGIGKLSVDDVHLTSTRR